MGITHTEATLQGSGGLKLFTHSHEVEKPVGGVVILHGYCEHSLRYPHVVEALNKADLNAYLLDHRGHGRSEGPRAAVLRFEEYLEDLDIFLRRVREQYQGPLFLLGHSMGGLIAATYALRRKPQLAGVVLSSPYLGLKIPLPLYKALAGRLISRLLPQANITSELSPSLLTHDQAIVADYISDPDVPKIANTRWFTEAAAAQAYCMAQAHTLGMPLLLMHGGDDRIADPDQSRRFVSRVNRPDAKIVILDGLYHEIFNEIGREAVIKSAVDWILEHSIKE